MIIQLRLLTFICMIKNKIYNCKQFFKMGHIILKRTKFQKGNFKPAWDCINVDLATLGKIKPSKVYQHYNLPYWFSDKITMMEKMHWKFYERKSIMNWLA